MSEENLFKKDIEKEFKDLKRRIKRTRMARIEASKRLRRKNTYYEKITHFYSLVVLILSVWFLNQSGDQGILAAKILLVMSLSLTYFTMFLSMRNYKERAGNFETNYQQLDVLTNRIDRFATSNKEVNEEDLKEFQREYEKLIIGKENHLNIDYYVAMSKKEEEQNFSKLIFWDHVKERVKDVIIAVYPFFLFILIFLFSKLIKLLDKL